MRMLDLYSGQLGWSAVFAARGWKVTAIDINPPRRTIPKGVDFLKADVLELDGSFFRFVEKMHGWIFDFACASSVCDGFASFGMRHFRPEPPYPAKEVVLFDHTRNFLNNSKIPYVMENVRTAQLFVGPAVAHCGPFYLWGNAVPPILPQGISKAKWKSNIIHGRNAPGNFAPELNLPKAERKAKLATIPPELANCVAEYAERLLEVRA